MDTSTTEQRTHLRCLRRYGFTYASSEREAERIRSDLEEELPGELTARRTGLPKHSQPEGPRTPARRRSSGPLYIIRHSQGPTNRAPKGLPW